MKKLSLMILGTLLAVAALFTTPVMASANTYAAEGSIGQPLDINFRIKDQPYTNSEWGSYITPANITLTDLDGLDYEISYGPMHESNPLYQYADVTISGIPTKAGVGSFTLEYTDGAGNSGTSTYMVNVKSSVVGQYVDENGNKLADDIRLDGNVDENYTTNAKEIDGWSLTQSPENASGTFTDQIQTITYVYEKPTAENIYVQYVDTDGNPLVPADIINGKINDTYTTSAKEIDGWRLKETPENASGAFTDQKQTVTYVYEQVQGTIIHHFIYY
ncbi:MucBP domain-containing protein [Listeria ilorinensis]|uniref:MucBP domain-containing protein n=1 Tax=Listeria ilorinensis TaxID=2867439 RepID=UPI001EF55684|nr:MucBP domain-containing protein [Listeria ilorinensis]